MQRGFLRWTALVISLFCAAAVAANKPAAVRIGVVAIQDHAGRSLGYSALDAKMLGLLRGAGFEPVPLRFQPAADLEATARDAGCAYILYTDIIDIHRTTGPHLGGAVRGIGGTLSGNERSRGRDIWEAEVEFRLFAVGQVLPVLSTSVTGRNSKSHAATVKNTPAKSSGDTSAAAARPEPNTTPEPNILLDATPVEETGRQRKHKSVAVAAALDRAAKLLRERINQPATSTENP